VAAEERTPPAFSRDAAAALRDYAWPGNIRELRHVVEFACQTAANTVTLTDLPDEVLATPVPVEQATSQPTLDDVERRYVAATLRAVHGNQTEAAVRLGISRKALWEKRKRYGMD
jgi:DNA-binding NtrC family response regulator